MPQGSGPQAQTCPSALPGGPIPWRPSFQGPCIKDPQKMVLPLGWKVPSRFLEGLRGSCPPLIPRPLPTSAPHTRMFGFPLSRKRIKAPEVTSREAWGRTGELMAGC